MLVGLEHISSPLVHVEMLHTSIVARAKVGNKIETCKDFGENFSENVAARNEFLAIPCKFLAIPRKFLQDKYRKPHVPTNIANKLVTLPYGKERNRTFAHRARPNAHGPTHRAEKHQKHARNHLHNPRMPRSRSLHLSQIAKKPANQI